MQVDSWITAAGDAVLSTCTATVTLNVVVQNSCTAGRRNYKPCLPIRPENNQTSIEVTIRQVFAPRVQGLSFQSLCPWARKFTSGRSRLSSGP